MGSSASSDNCKGFWLQVVELFKWVTLSLFPHSTGIGSKGSTAVLSHSLCCKGHSLAFFNAIFILSHYWAALTDTSPVIKLQRIFSSGLWLQVTNIVTINESHKQRQTCRVRKVLLQQVYSTCYLLVLSPVRCRNQVSALKQQNCAMGRFLERAGLTRNVTVEKVKPPVWDLQFAHNFAFTISAPRTL